MKKMVCTLLAIAMIIGIASSVALALDEQTPSIDETGADFVNEASADNTDEGGRQRDIMPLMSSQLPGFQIIDLPANASPQQWDNAIGTSGDRVIRVMGDQPNLQRAITIPGVSGGRHIIIASDGTNLTNNTRDGTPFTITRPPGTVDGRHFIVNPNATLTLVQIILDGRDDGNPFSLTHRGGVHVQGWPTSLNMLDGSEIRNCRADLGGGILAVSGATVLIDGGTLRNNVATSNRDGGGGGVRAFWRSHLTLRNTLIIDNKAVADYGHGGGVEIVRESTLTIEAGTVIERNTAGRRGGGIAIWFDSTGEMHDGQIIKNYAGESGGGIVLTGVNDSNEPADKTRFTMNGGTIEENTAGERGGGISGYHPTDAPFQSRMAEQTITINGGQIFDNRAPNGGGIWFYSGILHTTGGEMFDNKATNGAGVYWAEGPAVWTTAGNGIDIYRNEASGNGGGLATVGPNNRTIPAGVNIRDNKAQNGGGVWMGGSGILTMNHETKPISGNQATGHGGGVYISTGTFAQSGSGITENDATGEGGGVYVVNGSSFRGTGGFITDNIAHDGGGLYVRRDNLDNVSISPVFVFDGNFARNGLRIDSNLAENRRGSINPSTVTILDQIIIDEVPAGSGDFVKVAPHAFTNYDINALAPTFWRVTYAADEESEGEVSAHMESNGRSIENDVLLSDGTVLIFTASPAEQFESWTIGTREEETTADGKEVEFAVQDGGSVSPLRHILSAHTHVVGYFRTQPLTTTLTISKEVTGDFANRIMAFDFTVIFQDSAGNPLSGGGPLPYTITDSGGAVLVEGAFILDNSGSAVFRLAHGQAICIEDVPLEGRVQVRETPDVNYWTSFRDSADGSVVIGNETAMLPMGEDRVFEFINERYEVPPTGLDLGGTGGMYLLFLLVSLSALAVFGLRIALKRANKKYPFGCSGKNRRGV